MREKMLFMEVCWLNASKNHKSTLKPLDDMKGCGEERVYYLKGSEDHLPHVCNFFLDWRVD